MPVRQKSPQSTPAARIRACEMAAGSPSPKRGALSGRRHTARSLASPSAALAGGGSAPQSARHVGQADIYKGAAKAGLRFLIHQRGADVTPQWSGGGARLPSTDPSEILAVALSEDVMGGGWNCRGNAAFTFAAPGEGGQQAGTGRQRHAGRRSCAGLKSQPRCNKQADRPPLVCLRELRAADAHHHCQVTALAKGGMLFSLQCWCVCVKYGGGVCPPGEAEQSPVGHLVSYTRN